MSEKGINVDAKIGALLEYAKPRLVGKLVGQGNDHVAIQSGGSVMEVPRKAILHHEEHDGQISLTLADDAQIVVSTVVSAKKGFIADNVFGGLGAFMNSDNCNCNCSGGNCNCNCGGGSERMVEGAAARLDALAPGARRFRSFGGVGGE